MVPDKSRKILIISYHRKLRICITLKICILEHGYNLLIVNLSIPSIFSETSGASSLLSLDKKYIPES